MTNNIIFQIAITAALLIVYFVLRRLVKKFVFNHGKKHSIVMIRTALVYKSIKISILITIFMVIALIWNVSFKGFSVYFASFFTVAGIGLFAQWSIISNITASAILFFYSPFRIGSKIKIIDGDNSISGTIKDISLFALTIQSEDGQMISYPNNLVIQKPIMHE